MSIIRYNDCLNYTLRTIATVNVFSVAGSENSAPLGIQSPGTLGTIAADVDPVFIENTWWYKIDYEVAPSGWTREQNLMLAPAVKFIKVTTDKLVSSNDVILDEKRNVIYAFSPLQNWLAKIDATTGNVLNTSTITDEGCCFGTISEDADGNLYFTGNGVANTSVLKNSNYNPVFKLDGNTLTKIGRYPLSGGYSTFDNDGQNLIEGSQYSFTDGLTRYR